MKFLPRIKVGLIVLLVAPILIVSCNKDAGVNACDRKVVINKTQFEEIESDDLVVSAFSIEGNCLNITVRGGGCDGNSWAVNIIDSEEVKNTKPAERKLRVTLRSNELCQAFLSRDYSFDIFDLQVENNSVLLKFEETGDEILYSY